MPVTKKKNEKKSKNAKLVPSALVVVKTRISAKDTLFPEKVARAKKVLGKTKFL